MTRTTRRNRYASLCAALMLSSGTASAFAFTPIHTRPPSPVVRSATVVQRYRVENDIPQPDHHRKRPNTSKSSSQQSKDVFSLLPERVSVQRLTTPSEFQRQVVDERESLVVVRFYADTCPSCRATSSIFRKWSRGIVRDTISDSNSDEVSMPIKVLEMPLTKATSSFLQDELKVEQIPYCHLYHPEYGLIEEHLVMNRSDLKDFCHAVDIWSRGGVDFDLEGDEAGNCQEFC
mmetsp:Transcript_13325/g.20579  ORF Transcript_13325/g.20579 Transcript_13325/m.20579 type:complete len:233 (+) Transcript_13325:211-909(+)|eukprot:CAMPEP_0201714876 /NCGR_PEP_ID=MMETSP0593-20130828/1162_1 /ASSEMBLY_ACC=CAM_ASM_000672 /TAXON_ID=267983 /ORGANISM="Skeletonema japonicum, Strain CCMP2506" /LENGTH=232 /DNA_ID=CAMNT_0048204189 /DNA_START=134 /DNA_END=832 /DNA_ORIENTATION=-